MTEGDYWFRQRYDDAMYAQTEGMQSPVRCRWCGGIYDLGKVTVTARYTDCSMWKAPCCGVTADDRKPPWGVQHYTELPRPDVTCDDGWFPDGDPRDDGFIGGYRPGVEGD